MHKTLGRGLATSAQLALVAFLSIGLTVTTHDSVANTSSSLKTKVSVAAPSKNDLSAADKSDRLDKAMAALSAKEAAHYRALFEAQERGDWEKAEKTAGKISDRRLMGHVLADRIERRGATPQELAEWLRDYPSLPQAEAIHAKAIKAGVKTAPYPKAPETWRSGGEVDGAANFTPELMVKSTAPQSANNQFARDIQKVLRKGDPWAARNMLLEAQTKKRLVGTFAHDVEAVIAASFFSVGERDQATSLSGAAAGANQPLGLWIRGLIAWEKHEGEKARLMFARLAEHPALSVTNRAAANFWAYRAHMRDGSKAEANKYLHAAASVPRSFYGLLASQLLGRNPVSSLASTDGQPVWGPEHQALLSENQAGWRALALIQVGQTARAEAELRRLNPQGETDKQQAMLALASYVPMPALVLKLANLSKDRGFDTALYPVPPWQPHAGFQIDRALLFALARHESLFDPLATSHRGAQGLMQIMPATARVMADNHEDVQAITRQDKLLDPAYNMALGQKYVQHLSALPQIGNNLVLLLAAYNAGPAKAINWSSGKDKADPLLFLESIPIRETRNYVARVLPHYWAYRARLGRSTTSLRQMAEGKWPAVPLTEDKSLHLAEFTH